MRGVNVNDTRNADKRAIRLHQGGQYLIHGNTLREGHVYVKTWANARSTVSLVGNLVAAPHIVEGGDTASAVTRVWEWGNKKDATTVWDERVYVLRDVITVPFDHVDNSTGAMRRYISNVHGLSGTAAQAKNLRGSCAFTKALSTCDVNFPPANREPDANYFIAISCNVNRTVWVGSKTETGFTLRAAAAGTGRESCDWLLIR